MPHYSTTDNQTIGGNLITQFTGHSSRYRIHRQARKLVTITRAIADL